MSLAVEMKGYNFELAGQEMKEFQCTLCGFLLREAMELPCSHMNCQSCLWQWQMKQDSKLVKKAKNICWQTSWIHLLVFE